MYEELITVDWFTIAATLINTLILFLVLKHFLYLPVKKMLKAREDEVKKTYEDADSAKSQAEELKAAYDKRLSGVREEAGEILRDASRKAQAHADEILSDAQTKAEERMRRAEQQIQVEKRKAVTEAKDELAELAISAAERIMRKELDKEENEKLVGDFLDSLQLSGGDAAGKRV